MLLFSLIQDFNGPLGETFKSRLSLFHLDLYLIRILDLSRRYCRVEKFIKSGWEGEIRTLDQQINSLLR